MYLAGLGMESTQPCSGTPSMPIIPLLVLSLPRIPLRSPTPYTGNVLATTGSSG